MDKLLTTLTRRQRDIVSDLLEKWPKGPEGRYAQKHYRLSFQWVPAYERHTDFAVLDPGKFPRHWPDQPHIDFWGWHPEELFELARGNALCPKRGEDLAFARFEELVSAHAALVGDAPLSRAALTKRSRRLCSRLHTAVKHVQERGLSDRPGVWEVRSWDSPCGSVWRRLTVWGESRADVEARVRVVGPMLGLQEQWRLEFTFLGSGTPEAATSALLSMIGRREAQLQGAVADLESRLARVRAQLDEEQRAVAVLMGGALLLSPPGAAAGEEDDRGSEAD